MLYPASDCPAREAQQANAGKAAVHRAALGLKPAELERALTPQTVQ